MAKKGKPKAEIENKNGIPESSSDISSQPITPKGKKPKKTYN